MASTSLPFTLTAGAVENVNQLNSNLNALLASVNSVDNSQLDATTVMDKVGITGGGTTRRGAIATATAESTSSTSYTTLTTADKISSVVLPSNGLIAVLFQGIWQNTVANNARAAIFLGATQAKAGLSTGAPTVVENIGPTEVNDDAIIATYPTNGGAAYWLGGSGVGAATEVTTGQYIGQNASGGGVVYLFAAAGTYDVSVQFKNSAAGTLTVKNRHLWVWTTGF